MRLVIISDTHSAHEELNLSDGDVLVHCGDYSNSGRDSVEVIKFLNWFSAQPHKHKIFISGNHDGYSENSPNDFRALIPDNVQYLQDSACIVDGIKFYGSPVTPPYGTWYWMRGYSARKRHWAAIPDGTDVLITHGPPAQILDTAYDITRDLRSGVVSKKRVSVGCVSLGAHVIRLKPKVHCFGHIHRDGGKTMDVKGIKFVNAAVFDEIMELVHHGVVVDL